MTVSESAGPRPDYRPEIDGLRAAAVLPVVFYHFHVPGFSGGFAGVDIFFVISGYLITGLIFAEMRAKRFSILRFYTRRARRILPALFAMLIATAAVSAVVLFPDDLRHFAPSLPAAAAFVANFEFWRETRGYFDSTSELKPLVHTWSLAVEEQFYLVYPLLLIGLARLRKPLLLGAIGACALASFIFSAWSVIHWPQAAFYLLPARFWELMLGAMLSLWAPPVPAKPLANIAAGVGFISIAWAACMLTAATPFPGPAALLPCGGAALLLWSTTNRNCFANTILQWRPAVFVGLISYSLYLWHWPVFVFARYIRLDNFGLIEAFCLIALCFMLAVLSWKYIEKPFRAGNVSFSRPQLSALAAGVVLILLAFATAAVATRGLPQRYGPAVRTILAADDDREPHWKHCFGLSPAEVRAGKLCRIGVKTAAQPTFLLWGDSHADALLPAVELTAIRKDKSGLFASRSRCRPLLGISRSGRPLCSRFNDEVEKVARTPGIKTVILAALWSADTGSDPAAAGGSDRLTDDQAADGEAVANRDIFARGLERTIARLVAMGKSVTVVAPVPTIGIRVPESLAKIKLLGLSGSIRPRQSQYAAEQRFLFSQLRIMRQKYHIRVIYPHVLFCHRTDCRVAIGNRPLYRDGGHLTVFGAIQLSSLFKGVFDVPAAATSLDIPKPPHSRAGLSVQ